MKAKVALMTMAAFAMSTAPEMFPLQKPAQKPKNKFDLSPEDIEAMESMTPKEKKMFLRSKI
jgi:hypothetical protein